MLDLQICFDVHALCLKFVHWLAEVDENSESWIRWSYILNVTLTLLCTSSLGEKVVPSEYVFSAWDFLQCKQIPHVYLLTRYYVESYVPILEWQWLLWIFTNLDVERQDTLPKKMMIWLLVIMYWSRPLFRSFLTLSLALVLVRTLSRLF